MPSSRPERRGPGTGGVVARPPAGPALAGLTLVGLALAIGLVLMAGGAGAQVEPTPGPDDPAATTTLDTLRPPTTLVEDPFATDCSPGNIVVRPDCGREPVDPGDPGGWLQVSLFFLVCGVVLAIVGMLWRRSRRLREERARSGRDPLTVARRRGRGVRTQTRRSTRSEPVADTSENRPEASAGR